MSSLLQTKLPCEHCGSSDAVAEYTNNFFCFSCKLSTIKVKTPSTLGFSTWKELRLEPTQASLLGLPDTATTLLPKEAKAWLYKHHFTDDLIAESGILYNPPTARVILPCYDKDGLLLGLDARSLTQNIVGSKWPRYVSSGTKASPFIYGEGKSKILVIVEDLLSAMRVGQHYSCIALRGTHMGDELLARIVQKLDTEAKFQILLWLDGDKQGVQASEDIQRKLQWFGRTISLTTPKDPKCYTDSEIRRKITPYL